MTYHSEPVYIDFPLKGEWSSPNTPGSRIPSHGTDQFGETYAYDFVKVNRKDNYKKFYDISAVGYLLKGVPLEKCYGCGSEIFAPFDGVIVDMIDGVQERNPVNIFSDIRYMKRITRQFMEKKQRILTQPETI